MGRKTPPQFEVTIEHMVFGGEGLGYYDNRPVFVYGVLPGETVLVRPVKVSSRFVKAAVVEVSIPASERQQPQSSHYLTCSPWQVIPYEKQLEFKKETTLSMWKKIGKALPQAAVEITASPIKWEYRNKLEFSFMLDEQDHLQLAFHQRYRYSTFLPAPECKLGTNRLNECAQYVLGVLRKNNIPISVLKNVLVRYSYAQDACIVGLYVTDDQFEDLVVEHKHIRGFHILYSDPKTPAAITTKVLYSHDEELLNEQLLGARFEFRFDSFFQVNPPAFEKLMRYVEGIMSPTNTLLDLYAGVGTIGFLLQEKAKRIISLEYDEAASASAERNMQYNAVRNASVINGAAEKNNLADILSQATAVIVDPPRSGLHPDVTQAIGQYGPEQFIYISCNPATQARDWKVLSVYYTTVDWQLFDLYPQTPHVESVVVMKRK